AAGENLTRTGEIDGKPHGHWIEVHRIEIKASQILARLRRDLCPAIRKRLPAAIQSLGEIRNGAAKVAEYPLDVRIALGHAGEYELRRGECRVEQEADEWHQPIVRHRFHADRIRGMN